MLVDNLDPIDSEPESAVAESLIPVEVAQLYLQLLWPTHTNNGLICILQTPAKGDGSQKWSRLTKSCDTVHKLCEMSESADTRLSWCSYSWRKRCDSRALELPGLFIDIDVAGGHHNRDDLPTLDDALHAIDCMPRKVSLLLNTGGGLLAVWLFDQPLKIDDSKSANALLRRWEDRLRQLLPTRHVDKAARLTAVTRVPGTLNHKSGTVVELLRPELPAGNYSNCLTQLRQAVPRYGAAELEGLLPAVEETAVAESREYSQNDKATAIDAAAKLSPDQADDRETWIKVGLCLKEVSETEDCFQVWCDFSRKAERFTDTDDDEYRKTWDSFHINHYGNAVATLVGMAQDAGNNPGEITIIGVIKQDDNFCDDGNLLPDLPDDSWPKSLSEAALIGPVGNFVRVIEPFTEADPAALVFQLLVAFGNLIGRNAWFMAEADRHCANLFCVMVGQSAKGRKGISLGQVRRLIDLIQKDDGSDFDDCLRHWSSHCQADGLSTGAGLIWAVRDEVTRVGQTEDTPVIFDRGVSDKRLLVLEGEFAQILKVMKREGNDLSPVLRKAWDQGALRSLVKNSPSRATGAHISIIGHITKIELKSHLTQTEISNGFANRFLWACVRRSKILATPPHFDTANLQPVVEQLRNAVSFCDASLEVKRSDAAETIWQKCYPRLSRERFGVAGSLLSRAEAQVMRMAMIYALLEQSTTIEDRHLTASLELWRYVEDSVVYVFGNRTGHAVADTIHDAIKIAPDGMTRTDIHKLFNRNKSKTDIDQGLRVLLEAALIKENRSQPRTGRRSVWFCTV